MGTSASTIIKNRIRDWETNEEKDIIVAKTYRHYDGYPSGHGADIAYALYDAAMAKPRKRINPYNGQTYSVSKINNRNWCQHFFKELCKRDMDMEFIGAEERSPYCDFTYVITGCYDNFGGKSDIDGREYLDRINVKVYYDDEDNELLFDGNGHEYMEWEALKM